MKTACCSLVLLLSLTVSTVHSFGIVPFSVSCRVPFSTTTTTTSLQSTSVDSTAAIEAAMAASKEFGATSPEAQAAWEAVEEIRFGADNRYVCATYYSSIYFCDPEKKRKKNLLSVFVGFHWLRHEISLSSRSFYQPLLSHSLFLNPSLLTQR